MHIHPNWHEPAFSQCIKRHEHLRKNAAHYQPASFGEYLDRLMKKRHMTPGMLAMQLGHTGSTLVYRWRGNITFPKRSTVLVLADALNVPHNDMIRVWESFRKDTEV